MALANSKLGSATVVAVEPVEPGTQMLGFWKRAFVKIFIFSELPELKAPVAFCKLTAKLRPVPGSEITAQVWLPHAWNGKLLGTGGGGLNGGLGGAPIMLLKPVEKGYAALVTDAGHDETDSAKFAHEFPEQYIDYAYRANHVATDFAKELLSTYYGSPAKHAYFHGCSNGGRDALMEARRYPGDYDGIIAGAPAAGWSKLVTSAAWNAQAVRSAPRLEDKLGLVQQAAIDKCDALDGVEDQLIDNPMECRFDPVILQCTGSDSENCLVPEEVAALRKIYAGPALEGGQQVYPGMPMGGEALENNWDLWLVGKQTQRQLGEESLRWMAFPDPKWKIEEFDLDRDYPIVKEKIAPIMDSDDPDLSEFIAQGGKLLLYHGWNDAAIPAGATIEYYRALQERHGSSMEGQVRLFMVPGMMHCAGGVGPTDFDALDTIDEWVDTGTAPQSIIATEYDKHWFFGPVPGANKVRTRPLCPWPKAAAYNGIGSTDAAESFSCQ